MKQKSFHKESTIGTEGLFIYTNYQTGDMLIALVNCSLVFKHRMENGNFNAVVEPNG